MAPISPSLPPNSAVWQQTLQWQPNEHQQALFQQLFEGILEGNQQLNLTRITEPDEFWEKHLWDSLYGIGPWLAAPSLAKEGDAAAIQPIPVKQVIDIGTGGGFPGLPVAIAQPSWHLTCLDSTRKKMAFLKTLSQALGLAHLQTITDRAEALGHHRQHREAYDLALIRAVGPAPVCAEYALPFVKVNGMVVLYRGQWSDDEAAALEQAVKPLGGGEIAIAAATTPLSQGVRHCIYIHKSRPTAAEFSRAVGIPAKQPLGTP